MLQAVMSAPRKFTLREVPEPRITGEEECLLEVRACGICGSDMHPYLGEGFVSTYDRVPGHEFCGTVLEIRSARGDIRRGDKVVINPAVPCFDCELCRRGLGYVCEQCEVIGGERPGAFCERIVVPASTLYKLPDDIDFTEAALVEPVAFAEHCTSGLDGANVVVIGQGAIGLSCSMVLRYKGASITALDISDAQLEMAKKLCGAATVNSGQCEPVEKVQELMGGRPVDYVIDTVFNQWSVNFALDVLRKGGTAVTVGVPIKNFEIDAFRMLCREVSLRTRYLYTDEDFATAVSYIAERKIDFRPLISKCFPLDRIGEAFAYKASTPSLKVVVTND